MPIRVTSLQQSLYLRGATVELPATFDFRL